MESTYNPYQDIQNVLNAKIGWNTSTTDEERKKQEDIANAARKRLEDYGYEDISKQISAEGADATTTRKILEQYAPKPTYTDNELINKNNNEVNQYTNQLIGTQFDDKKNMTQKYDKLEETAYSNPFETEEGKAIMGKYDLSAMQGRDNAVASGGASNGGNIDSYAAANAMRQQASILRQGQSAVLDAHNNKINNVKGILESLGVYQQNQDKGIQNSIGILQTEGQRLFDNDQTAKNNEVARLVEESKVTGYVPNEWTIKNDPIYSQFLNTDGTFKKEMEHIDIQALINQTNDPETKKKLAVVRTQKGLDNYDEYGKYLSEGDTGFMEGGQITEARRESQQNDATVRESLKTEKEINDADNQTEKEINDANNQAQKDLLEIQNSTVKPTSYSISDEVVPLIKTVMSKVNNAIATHRNGKGVTDAMKYEGDGVFTFTPPQYQAGAWKYVLCNAIIDSGVPSDQIGILLNQLGLTYDEFEEVYNNRNN